MVAKQTGKTLLGQAKEAFVLPKRVVGVETDRGQRAGGHFFFRILFATQGYCTRREIGIDFRMTTDAPHCLCRSKRSGPLPFRGAARLYSQIRNPIW